MTFDFRGALGFGESISCGLKDDLRVDSTELGPAVSVVFADGRVFCLVGSDPSEPAGDETLSPTAERLLA
jgi:hypothetical protein